MELTNYLDILFAYINKMPSADGHIEQASK